MRCARRSARTPIHVHVGMDTGTRGGCVGEGTSRHTSIYIYNMQVRHEHEHKHGVAWHRIAHSVA
jgi:hypothetical protein